MRVVLISNMYPSAEEPSYGIFIQNHVKKMEAEHGVRFELAVSTRRPASRAGKLAKYAALYGRTLSKLPRDFDLIHVQYPSALQAPAALALAAARRKPLIVTSHGGDVYIPPLEGPERTIVAQFLKRADAVIAVSREVARHIDALGVGRDRIRVIDMGCDVSLFTFTLGEEKRRAKKDLGLDPDRALLFFAGELIPRKGCDIFFDALARLDSAVSHTVALAGSGPEKGALEAHPFARAHADRLRWLGAIPQRELAKWYAAADVFVFPTRDEPLGLVTLEAMASGTPVIASRIGGVPEIIEHEENGLLFGVERAEELADQLQRLLGDRELGIRLARRGLETARAHSLDRQVERVVEVYRSVLHKA